MMTLQETGRTSFGVSIAMTVLATLAMAGRFLAKWKTGNSIRLEDWLIIFGFSTFIAYVAVLLHGVISSGGTLDKSQMSLVQLTNAFKFVYVAESLFTTTLSAAKFSILSLYCTIFSTSKVRRASIIIGILCLVWYIVCLLVNIFQCKPLVAAWQLELVLSGQGKCIIYGNFIIGYEITNIILDALILAIPVYMIKGLQLSTMKKAVIIGVFLLGGFVIISCIIRIAYLNSAQTSNPVGLSKGLDWSTVELAIAITCACLPLYGPFLPTDKMANVLDQWYLAGTVNTGVNNSRGNRRQGYNFAPDTDDGQLITHISAKGNPADHEGQYPLQSISQPR